ncbi:hypothetical protein [Bacillus sp. 1P06AnD]|uniref:hypothetical protein n=1 Tax=Bacillus sp. 1P06AnD TaxID=3132208 RepID=UPI0039A23467
MKNRFETVVGHSASLKKTILEKISEHSLPIPISQQALQWILNHHSDTLDGMHVDLIDEKLVLRGKYRAGIIPVPFELICRPVSADKRILCFYVEQMKPINQEWLRKKVFNSKNGSVYKEGHLYIDCNQMKTIKSLPLGSIKDMYVKKQTLWLKIGV